MKHWCCLFTCLTARAVHIEIVRSCSVAINRFFARRDKPTTIISDNGTNFVGSSRVLKGKINSWNQYQITSELAQNYIAWNFNPPGALQFGGVLAQLVRSCKKALIAILGNRSLTDEYLTTIMCFVEQLLKARPLTPASDDPSNLEAITPIQFLWDMFVYPLSPMLKIIPITARCLDRVKRMRI